MPRPALPHPTPNELEVLKVLWERGPCTVREVMQVLNRDRPRHYTSVMSLLNVMTYKGLLKRRPKGRAFEYQARSPREKTLGHMVQDVVQRAFEGSASTLVGRLLDSTNPSQEELERIRQLIVEHGEMKEEQDERT